MKSSLQGIAATVTCAFLLGTLALGSAPAAKAYGEPGDQNVEYFYAEFVQFTGRGFKNKADGARKIAAQVCIDLARGIPSDQLAESYAGDNLTADDARILISRAAYHFCPSYRNN